MTRQWVLAEQPGREVAAVRDAEGYVWRRVSSAAGLAFDQWTDHAGLALSWSQLLVEFGPLEDATDEACPVSHPGSAAGDGAGVVTSPTAGAVPSCAAGTAGEVASGVAPVPGATDPSTVDGA